VSGNRIGRFAPMLRDKLVRKTFRLKVERKPLLQQQIGSAQITDSWTFRDDWQSRCRGRSAESRLPTGLWRRINALQATLTSRPSVQCSRGGSRAVPL